MPALGLQISVDEAVVFHALLVVALEYGSGICALLDLADLDGNLGVFAPLLLLLFWVVLDLGGGCDLLEARVVVRVLVNCVPDHADGESLLWLLQHRYFRGELCDFVHEVDADPVVPFGVEFYKFAVELDEFGEVGLVLLPAVGLLLSQHRVDKLFRQAVRPLLGAALRGCPHQPAYKLYSWLQHPPYYS